jgi:deoxycytidylate deaminase
MAAGQKRNSKIAKSEARVPPARGNAANRSVEGSAVARETLGLHPFAKPYEVYTGQESELVIGLVGPLGTDNDKIIGMITNRLREYQYETEVIRISSVIFPALVGAEKMPTGTAYERANGLINLGNAIRRESDNNAVLAIAAAAEIGRRRPQPNGPTKRLAYIVSSLKLPDEVAELRKIYGRGFCLFAVHTDRDRRVRHLTGKGMKRPQAWELIERDEYEPEEYGQDTRDTFHRADFFVADENNDDKLCYAIERCLDLMFGNPTITPTFNEFAMFMAFAASLSSADLSRQVGAVVAKGNEILSTGANDCPSPGGGRYWPAFIGDRVDDLPRGRDYKRGCDSNTIEKSKLVKAIVEEFPVDIQARAEEILWNSPIEDITEYGRVVHAEMEALLACARGATSCVGATLYCTTFPCHNCAKHIIAAGIEQVVYVEPYPKSKALEFHDDAVTTGKLEGEEKKVRFKPFIGVGPRQFFDLFSLSPSFGRRVKRKTDDGQVKPWVTAGAVPRTQLLPVTHRKIELLAAAYLNTIKKAREAE